MRAFCLQSELFLQRLEHIEWLPFACNPGAATTEMPGCATSECRWDQSINLMWRNPKGHGNKIIISAEVGILLSQLKEMLQVKFQVQLISPNYKPRSELGIKIMTFSKCLGLMIFKID